MKKQTKLTLICSLSLVMLGSVGFGLAGAPETAIASAATDDSLNMKTGASLYLKEVTGLRFAYTTSYKSDTNYGMLIVPKDVLDSANIEIADTTDYIALLEAAKAQYGTKVQYIVEENLIPVNYTADTLPEAGTEVEFRHSITELKAYNYDRNFFGIGFTKNGDTYSYAQNNDNVRSALNVASRALNDYYTDTCEWKELYEKNNDILANFIQTGVTNVDPSFQYEIQGANIMYIGDTQTLTVNKTSGIRNTQLNALWETSDESKLSVDKNGEVKAIASGVVTVTAKSAQNTNSGYYTDEFEITVKIRPTENFKALVENANENTSFDNVNAAYQQYKALSETEKAEVETEFTTLWELVPSVLNQDYFVDWSSELAVAYNNNYGMYGKDASGNVYLSASETPKIQWNAYTGTGITFEDGYTPSVSVKPNGQYWHVNNDEIDGIVYKGGALLIALPQVTEDTMISFYANLDNAGYVAVVTEADRFAYGTGEAGYFVEEKLTATGTVKVTATLKANTQCYIRLRSKPNNDWQFFHTGFTTVLSSVKVVTAVENFESVVAALSSSSTEAELLNGLKIYRALTSEEQTSVATSYATLETLIKGKLNKDFLVDWSSELAVAYNNNYGMYGKDASGNVYLSASETPKIQWNAYTGTGITFEDGYTPSVSVKPNGQYWHVNNDEIDGIVYKGGALLIALPQVTEDTMISFYANLDNAGYVAVVTEADRFAYGTGEAGYFVEEKLTATGTVKVTATLKANTQCYIRLRSKPNNDWQFFHSGFTTVLSSVKIVTE